MSTQRGPRRLASAALLSLGCAIVVAVLAFPTPLDVLAAGLWRVAPTCVEVAAILLGGVLLNELMSVGGANERLADWLATVCREPARAVVLILLGVTPFAESVTGFGVGVVIAVPLLLRLGLAPTRAAITGLLGLVTVPWGALGPGTLVAAQFTGVDLRQLGVHSALLSLPVFLMAAAGGLITAVGPRRARRTVPELLIGVAALGFGVWAVNVTIGVPLAGVLGSVFSIGVLLLAAGIRERRKLTFTRRLAWALRPYACLVVGLLGGRALASALPGAGAFVSSPASWLLATCALTPWLLRIPPDALVPAGRTALARWTPVAVTTVTFLVLGALLTVTGMSAAVAGAAAGLGEAYLFLAAFIGALGGFVTGTNVGANAMLVTSQATAAHALGVGTLSLVAVQNVAASLATMASVPRVALAVGLAGHEAVQHGRVLRTVLLVDIAILAVLGGVTVIGT
ncbi:MAG: L-lactate permease [Pseudonocardiaceae bacterium]|nr:L-lactate permease [Pseudonocardiaceae bacterium]